MKIDAHQHFWNFTAHAEDYVWMSDEYGALRRDFLPDDLAPLLAEIAFDGTVAVQAREMVVETDFLLELADSTPWMLGVIGWVDLCSPNAEPLVERLPCALQEQRVADREFDLAFRHVGTVALDRQHH